MLNVLTMEALITKTLIDESRSFGGQPKGSTNEALRDLKFKEKLALNWVAVEFEKAKENGRSQVGHL